MGSAKGLVLPAGVSIQAGRETSQSNSQGTVVQGMVFTIRLPSGTTTSVFVPYSHLHDLAAVQRLIDERVGSLMAITG